MTDCSREAELNQALELLHFAFRAVVAKPDELLASRGLARLHHRILFFIRKQPQISVNELCRTLGISKQALNAPLRQLTTQKLVVWNLASHDRRVKQLRLTSEGARLEYQLSGDQRDRFEAAFTQAGPEAEAAWCQIMRLLADDLNRA